MIADSAVLLCGHASSTLAMVFGVSIWGYFRRETEEEFLAAGRTDRPVGRRRRARRDADQRRHVRRHAGPALSDRRQLDLDLVRRLGRLGHLRDVRRAEAAAVRRADGRRLRRQAVRQRRRPHAGGRADHRHLHDLLTAQFQAIGEIASAVFGIAPMVAMVALLASTGFYTVLGGVRSSSYIEFVQTLIMVLALVCRRAGRRLCTSAASRALGEYVGSIEPRVTGWWFTWTRAARVRPGVRPRRSPPRPTR